MGITFFISLRRPDRAKPVPPEKPVFQGLTRAYRVLVLEDNDDARLLLMQMLAAWGFEVFGGVDIDTVLERMGENKVPDIIVTDQSASGCSSCWYRCYLDGSLAILTP